jgi:hypothetical protein
MIDAIDARFMEALASGDDAEDGALQVMIEDLDRARDLMLGKRCMHVTQDGAICGRSWNVNDAFMDIPLCPQHRVHMEDNQRYLIDLRTRHSKRLMHQAWDETDQFYNRMRLRALPPPLSNVVYYINTGHHGLLKIGHAKDFASRFATHRSYWPFATLLAAEPGGHDVERSRHDQFRHLRIKRTELFRFTAELREFVNEIGAS